MANHKSARKRAQQTIKRTFVNKSKLARARTAIKALRMAISQGDKTTAQSFIQKVQSLLSRTNGPANTVARKISRLARQVTRL